ncbi:hypothetical protein QWJ34_00645 [Saccharibacillus sp. CPCC 101409]|uniref:hypothetical protein n=1 Tax=Saccharibacillus sp. CPCC 101409 TaxID=3058041 RepID=UPI0026740854|nr:hypothetical protein [Saccharibacillus sp. CPCC 101409]MDO3408266.1 hypothetical protein [Saccharibacillus sp. CPCC 101409]
MSHPKPDQSPIVIHELPQMANWLHPQTPEREQELLERAELIKKRYREKRRFKRFQNKIRSGEITGRLGIEILTLNASQASHKPKVLLKLKKNDIRSYDQSKQGIGRHLHIYHDTRGPYLEMKKKS